MKTPTKPATQDKVNPNVRKAHGCIQELLYAEVIHCTIGVMRNLQQALLGIRELSQEEREILEDSLLNLTSESIREALHRGELGITNGIIREKNRLLKAMGHEIPESHQEIDASKYGNYRW